LERPTHTPEQFFASRKNDSTLVRTKTDESNDELIGKGSDWYRRFKQQNRRGITPRPRKKEVYLGARTHG